jgi:pyrroline-5-carboxylate reductase
MLRDKKLLFIGAGNMAEALINGLLGGVGPDLPKRENIRITEIQSDRREYIQKKFEVASCLNNREGVQESDIILFAVKPQNIKEVVHELQGIDLRSKFFITIAAGVPISVFEEGLGPGSRVIRVMPNMAALIGLGISGISRGRFATIEDENVAAKIMEAVGEVVKLPEQFLDAVTAISGSGPAYFFYFMEALREAGLGLGLDPKICSRLVQATALGAVHLIQETGETPESLRKKVTSPGGTTEAALRFFEDHKFKDLIAGAVQRAEMRSKEFSQGSH